MSEKVFIAAFKINGNRAHLFDPEKYVSEYAADSYCHTVRCYETESAEHIKESSLAKYKICKKCLRMLSRE